MFGSSSTAEEFYVSWTSSAPLGTVFQVYVDRRLTWFGKTRFCHAPIPAGSSRRNVWIEVGTVDSAEQTTDFSASLTGPGGTGDRTIDLDRRFVPQPDGQERYRGIHDLSIRRTERSGRFHESRRRGRRVSRRSIARRLRLGRVRSRRLRSCRDDLSVAKRATVVGSVDVRRRALRSRGQRTSAPDDYDRNNCDRSTSARAGCFGQAVELHLRRASSRIATLTWQAGPQP